MKRAFAGVLTAVLAVSAFVPSASARPRSWTMPVLSVDTTCAGERAPEAQENVFSGILTLESATLRDNGAIRVRADLTGWCGVEDGAMADVDTSFGARITITGADCTGFTFTLPDKTRDGITVHFSAIELRMDAPAKALRGQFCALAAAVENGNSQLIATQLNTLLQTLNLSEA